jgi:DNA-directed RNA polymerase specialized sigma24 family protein
MSPNGSQSPDALDVEQLKTKVSKAVRHACRFYNYQANRDEVEDLSQDVLFKLLKNDGRVLQSFASRSSVDTWLYTVVRRELRPYFLRQQREKENLINVDDLSPETLRKAPYSKRFKD